MSDRYKNFNFAGTSSKTIRLEINRSFARRKAKLSNVLVESLQKVGDRISIVYKASYSGKKSYKLLPPSGIKSVSEAIKNDLQRGNKP